MIKLSPVRIQSDPYRRNPEPAQSSGTFEALAAFCQFGMLLSALVIIQLLI